MLPTNFAAPSANPGPPKAALIATIKMRNNFFIYAPFVKLCIFYILSLVKLYKKTLNVNRVLFKFVYLELYNLLVKAHMMPPNIQAPNEKYNENANGIPAR
jgi:hypothetical protein